MTTINNQNDSAVEAFNKELRILVLVYPAQGHLIPMRCLINELSKQPNVKIYFPSTVEQKKSIEAAIKNVKFVDFQVDYLTESSSIQQDLDQIVRAMMNVADQIIPKLIKFIDDEKIDLIVYDFLTLYAKWTLEILEKRHKNSPASVRAPPKAVQFSPTFGMYPDLYPNEFEMKLFPLPRFGLSLIGRLICYFVRAMIFCFKHGIKLRGPVGMVQRYEDLNLVCIANELQPKAQMFPKSFHFIGDVICRLIILLKLNINLNHIFIIIYFNLK